VLPEVEFSLDSRKLGGALEEEHSEMESSFCFFHLKGGGGS